MPLRPTGEQIKAIAESALDGPVVMLNLLKFEQRAKTDDGAAMTGQQSYQRYGDEVRSHMESVGAKVLWRGRVDSVVIGDEADHWDSAILVEYPSRKAFMEMTSSSAYGEVSKHRGAALVDSRLIAMTEQFRAPANGEA